MLETSGPQESPSVTHYTSANSWAMRGVQSHSRRQKDKASHTEVASNCSEASRKVLLKLLRMSVVFRAVKQESEDQAGETEQAVNVSALDNSAG